MKGIQIKEHGGAEVLRYEAKLPTPEPGSKEVLVRVKACALNRLDLWVRNGVPAYQTPLPHILGSDVAGEVEAVGVGVQNVKIGDHVVLNPIVSCGKCSFCKRGRDNLCENLQVIGAHRAGGYAEYIVVPERGVHPKPALLSFEEAAAVPLVFLTAWHMMVTRAKLQPGEWVLVMGASSGVGSAAIQIAKLMGAPVIATAGSPEKMERAREIGADEVVNHYDEDWFKQVKEKSEGSLMDVIVEHVGQAVFNSCVKLMAKGGRLVTCGATTGPTGEIDLRYIFSREIEILGSYIGTNAELKKVLSFVQKGHLKPIIDSVSPLKEAKAAHQKMESGNFFGKIVLQVK